MKKTNEVKENTVKENTVKENETIKATPLYKGYLAAYGAEEKATSKTAEKIKAIKETGLTITEFFNLLWAEKYPVPAAWPLNTAGLPLSPLSSKTRAALPEINRLVSALAMRDKRKKEASKKAPKKEADNNEGNEGNEGNEENEGNEGNEGPGAQIASFDKALCVKQLQALLVRSFEVEEDQVIYDLAKRLVQLLLDKK